jgi:hypothetical protein
VFCIRTFFTIAVHVVSHSQVPVQQIVPGSRDSGLDAAADTGEDELAIYSIATTERRLLRAPPKSPRAAFEIK